MEYYLTSNLEVTVSTRDGNKDIPQNVGELGKMPIYKTVDCGITFGGIR